MLALLEVTIKFSIYVEMDTSIGAKPYSEVEAGTVAPPH